MRAPDQRVARVVLDVSGLRDIEVDPVAGTARVGSGLRLGDVDSATQRFGLAVPLGTDSEVGVAGLTLGGGNGWLMGAHGATVDSLLSVELVCADGTLRLASADVEPDLFWALRGVEVTSALRPRSSSGFTRLVPKWSAA